MGWNDRLFEDPYRAYQSQDDRDAYDNWLEYLESLAAEAGGLSSNNVLPADSRGQNPPVELMDRLSEVLQDVEPWQISNDVPGQSTDENSYSRQPACNPKQHENGTA